jgi:hypothetical protein
LKSKYPVKNLCTAVEKLTDEAVTPKRLGPVGGLPREDIPKAKSSEANIPIANNQCNNPKFSVFVIMCRCEKADTTYAPNANPIQDPATQDAECGNRD